MSAFRLHRQVEYAETDMAGIVHFSEFFRYMESAEHAFFRSLGLSLVAREGERSLIWPRVSVSFDFREPLRFEDAFDVAITLEKLTARSATFKAVIERDGRTLATGRSTSVCCERGADGALKAVAIPDEVRRKLEAAAAPGARG